MCIFYAAKLIENQNLSKNSEKTLENNHKLYCNFFGPAWSAKRTKLTKNIDVGALPCIGLIAGNCRQACQFSQYLVQFFLFLLLFNS